mmetsp:Transcript_27/g.114  ORF Transcript_27/g.114 Transcript_27/m.114 type:complete len:238 (-) Transcript_27:162-875(-)
MHRRTHSAVASTHATSSSTSNMSSSWICATRDARDASKPGGAARDGSLFFPDDGSSFSSALTTRHQRSMASFMRSAAVPCTSVFTARRSASARADASALPNPGRGRSRAASGRNAPRARRASSRVSRTNRRNEGNAAYKARVMSPASSRDTPSLCAKPASPCPYRRPYTVVLAFARSAGVTGAEAATPLPSFQIRSNASLARSEDPRSSSRFGGGARISSSFGSRARCASTRSSICE